MAGGARTSRFIGTPRPTPAVGIARKVVLPFAGDAEPRTGAGWRTGGRVADAACPGYPPAMDTPTARIGILTVSDRASRGEYADEGGPAIREYLAEVLASPWEALERIVPDDVGTIAAALVDFAAAGCCLVVTTGGTGPAPRDVTPEATERVCSRMLPGFGELMRSTSLEHVPTAILSRQTAGVRDRTLVVNLPGRPRSIRQCLDAVFPAIPYCVDLVHTGVAHPPRLETRAERMVAFRPKG